MTAHKPIVVGVDGQSALQAVTWAAREAVYHDAPLVLVTVTSAFGDPGSLPGYPPGSSTTRNSMRGNAWQRPRNLLGRPPTVTTSTSRSRAARAHRLTNCSSGRRRHAWW